MPSSLLFSAKKLRNSDTEIASPIMTCVFSVELFQHHSDDLLVKEWGYLSVRVGCRKSSSRKPTASFFQGFNGGIHIRWKQVIRCDYNSNDFVVMGDKQRPT